MIQLSNGKTLRYVAASGALGFDGLGWPHERWMVRRGLIRPELFSVTIKSLTLNPREGFLGLDEEGNTKLGRWWTCIRPLVLRRGAVNRVNLTNGGVDWWIEKVAPTIDWDRYELISSIFGTPDEAIEIQRKLNRFPFIADEVNLSCPNTGAPLADIDQIVATAKARKEATDRPGIYKLSAAQPYVQIVVALDGLAEAVSLNSVPWEKVYPHRRSPLWRLQKAHGGPGGGVSGVPAQRLNWAAVQAIRMQAHNRVAVIAPSVMRYGDVAKARRAGGQAISFGTCFMLFPWRPTRIVLRDMRENPQP